MLQGPSNVCCCCPGPAHKSATHCCPGLVNRQALKANINCATESAQPVCEKERDYLSCADYVTRNHSAAVTVQLLCLLQHKLVCKDQLILADSLADDKRNLHRTKTDMT